jgi:hypothetical protein
MENDRCRYTPSWKEPYPRDEHGSCLCENCEKKRQKTKALRERQKENLDDAYLCRYYGKPQCEMTYDDWKVVDTLKINLKLTKKIKETYAKQY